MASRLGAMIERVRNGVDGLLVTPNDAPALHQALQRLCQNSELLVRLRSGIEPVKTFDDHVLEIEALYESVLSRSRGTYAGGG